MRFTELQSDEVVLTELGQRVARARLSRNLSQVQLAREAGVARETVQRLEAGEGIRLTAFVRVLRALGLLSGLDAAIPDALESPIEQLDRGTSRRRRASQPRRQDTWRWGTP
jgi:transcriptional regulator with XRE-family HTH domain